MVQNRSMKAQIALVSLVTFAAGISCSVAQVAPASLSLTNRLRLYAHYDGKLRTSFQSHQGVVGLEVRW